MEVPSWFRQIFSDFRNNLVEAHQVLHISIVGTSKLLGIPDLLEWLAREPERPPLTTEEKENIENARKDAELAEREIKNGFPLLHAQFAIYLWGSLEALIKTFLAAVFQNIPDIMKLEALQKVKIALGEYESMSIDERIDYLIHRLEDDLRTTTKSGVNRFESLLGAIGLGGTVEDSIRKDLHELYHVRNVLVHRRGYVDRRLLEECPWLNFKIGEKLIVKPDALWRYFVAVKSYSDSVFLRTKKKLFPKPPQ